MAVLCSSFIIIIIIIIIITIALKERTNPQIRQIYFPPLYGTRRHGGSAVCSGLTAHNIKQRTLQHFGSMHIGHVWSF
jgi:hypothetical protein